MEKLLYFDYCSLLITLALLVSTIYRGMIKGRLNKAYLQLAGIGLLSVMADIFAVWFDHVAVGNLNFVVQQYITHTLYLLFHTMTLCMYIIYFMILSDTDHKMVRINQILFSTPFSIVILLLIQNFFTKSLFYISETGEYCRGKLFIVMYIVALIYVSFAFVHVIKYRKIYGRDKFFALVSIFPIMLAATVAQYFMPKMLFEMFSNAMGLLLISTMVHKAEEYIDSDTGLGKLTAYMRDVRKSLGNGKEVVVVMMNIQNFTPIKEMLGYEAMSGFLRFLADDLEELNKENSFGGENYYIGNGKFRMVFNFKKIKNADEAAELLLKRYQRKFRFNDMDISIVPIICQAKLPEDIDNMDSLMAFGDDLFSAKEITRVLYAKDIFKKKKYDAIRNIDAIMEKALADHSFMVYYQPIFSIEANRFTSAEALLRLKDESFGFISPEIFIPAAEKNGMIHRIGAYVFEEVCKFISSDEYKRLGLEYIEINLSVVQCMRNDLIEELTDIMTRYHIAPASLNLEITETAAAFAQDAMLDNINKLNDMGISISLDDFGTGYSNMSRISSMPFEIIKLDKTFVNEERNPRMQKVLINTVRMIKDLDMKIVVEGVETLEMVRQFVELKCEYIQGYYYSKPLPREDFVKFALTKNE